MELCKLLNQRFLSAFGLLEPPARLEPASPARREGVLTFGRMKRVVGPAGLEPASTSERQSGDLPIELPGQIIGGAGKSTD